MRVTWCILNVLFFAMQANAQAYYPLSIGNRWTYATCNASIPEDPQPLIRDTISVYVVSDTLAPNGHYYFRIAPYDFTFNTYVRADSCGIYYWDRFSSIDERFYNLKSSIADIDSGESYHQTCLAAIDTLVVFGQSTVVRTYMTNEGLAYLGKVRYSDLFGPLTQWLNDQDPPWPWPTYTMDLIGCTINGVSYGFTVGVHNEPNLPSTTALHANYPNPFNSSTTLLFELEQQSDVILEIYDILGRLVWRTALCTQSAGTHTVRWNGSDNQGIVLSSGVYLCRLRSSNTVLSRKIVLLR